jgi:hypothetical protein
VVSRPRLPRTLRGSTGTESSARPEFNVFLLASLDTWNSHTRRPRGLRQPHPARRRRSCRAEGAASASLSASSSSFGRWRRPRHRFRLRRGRAHVCRHLHGRSEVLGSNSNGQLGDATTHESLVPVAVKRALVRRPRHLLRATRTCAGTSGGAVACWGATSRASSARIHRNRPAPAAVTASRRASKLVSAGGVQLCALTSTVDVRGVRGRSASVDETCGLVHLHLETGRLILVCRATGVDRCAHGGALPPSGRRRRGSQEGSRQAPRRAPDAPNGHPLAILDFGEAVGVECRAFGRGRD